MEINYTTRNRRLGYLGAAVATLLTPAGKLISSAVAAGVTVALITMSDPKVTDVPKTPVPNPVASSELLQEYFANELTNTSDLSIPVTGAEVLPTKNNSAGLQLTPMPTAVDIASNTANGPSGGSFLDIPALGAGFGPPNILISNPQVDCEQVLKKDASERTALEKALCELQIAQTEEIKEEILQLITYGTSDNGDQNPGIKPLADNDPPLITGNGPSLTDGTSNNGDQNPRIKPLADNDRPLITRNGPSLPADPGTPKKNPDDSSTVLPSEPVFRLASDVPVTIAAIPEPSTIGLLLLGLFSLGWASRRTTGV